MHIDEKYICEMLSHNIDNVFIFMLIDNKTDYKQHDNIQHFNRINIASERPQEYQNLTIDTAQNIKMNNETNHDTPEPWGLFFQDNATPQMEGLEELHNNIMFYLCIILFAVTWVMLSIILNYRKNKARISNKYVNHGTLVELIWTITPALILILIAFPSFKLLYLMDEVIDPSLVIYGENDKIVKPKLSIEVA